MNFGGNPILEAIERFERERRDREAAEAELFARPLLAVQVGEVAVPAPAVAPWKPGAILVAPVPVPLSEWRCGSADAAGVVWNRELPALREFKATLIEVEGGTLVRAWRRMC